MIYFSLNDPDQTRLLRQTAVFATAIDWMQANPNPEVGEYALSDDDSFFVRVMEYQTCPPEEARFESHRRYIDIQASLSGSEIIEIARSEALVPDGSYKEENDVTFYHHRPAASRLHMEPGSAVVLFPNDVHRPKVQVGETAFIKKLCFKIDHRLIEAS